MMARRSRSGRPPRRTRAASSGPRPAPDAAAARVRVTSTGAVPAGGMGPAFQIVTPALAVTSPAAGASWAIGTARTISWSSSNLPAGTTVRVELSRRRRRELDDARLRGDRRRQPGVDRDRRRRPARRIVRVSANGGVPAVRDQRRVHHRQPVGDRDVARGGRELDDWNSRRRSRWTSNLLPSATVKIRAEPQRRQHLHDPRLEPRPTPGASPGPRRDGVHHDRDRAVCRRTASPPAAVSGTFSLAAASVTVTSPNTAVTWTVGTVHAITWTHNLGAERPVQDRGQPKRQPGRRSRRR